MKPLAIAALAVCATTLPACHQATAAVQPPPDILRATLETLGDGDKPADRPLPGMFQRVNITPDGIPDWVVDFSNDQSWCGSGGCHLVIYVSQPDGAYKVAFEQQTREWRITRRAGRANLDVEVYGDWCGGPGVAECWLRFMWDGARFVEAPNAAGQTRLHGPLYAPLEDRPSPLSRAPVLVPCAAKPPAPPELAAASVPDLDGDGVRDAILQSDTADGRRETEVLVSSAGFATVLVIPGEDHSVDIATRPARLWAAPPGQSSDKSLISYRWNASACRFEPTSP